MSPFRGQSSRKPSLTYIKHVSTLRAKHNGAPRLYFAIAVEVVMIAETPKDQQANAGELQPQSPTNEECCSRRAFFVMGWVDRNEIYADMAREAGNPPFSLSR